MTKESERRKDKWRKINMVQRMNVLGKINNKWMGVEKRTQQTLDQYLQVSTITDGKVIGQLAVCWIQG